MLKKKSSFLGILKIVSIILFLVALYFPIFMHLGSLPIASWDEALFALRALYTHDTGEYLINFNQFDGLMDHMSTKLPFTTFFQVIGLKVFGVNELGIRLPIAFLFLGMAFYTSFIFKKYFKSYAIGMFFILLLVSNLYFIGEHMLRTGNQDVPFAMYLLLAILSFYLYNRFGNWKNLLLFCFFMLAALLTKNLLALIILPGLGAYTLISRERRTSVLLNKKTYAGVGIVLGGFALTILYYNLAYPGFFQRMWDYELMGRYSTTIENHDGAFTYYIEQYFTAGNYGLNYTILIGGFSLFDRNMSIEKRNVMILLLFSFISYLLVISNSATKTEWYGAPLYPLGALISAIGIHHFIFIRFPKRKWVRFSLLFIVLGFISLSYIEVVEAAYKPRANHKEQFYGELIKDKSHLISKEFTILDRTHFAAAFFEKEKRNRTGEYKIQIDRQLDNIELPTEIMTCEPKDKYFIENNTKYKLIDDEHTYCKIYFVEEILK